MTSLARIQRHVGVSPDGIWGPQTGAAIAKALGIAERGPTALADPAAFFAHVRKPVFGGTMSRSQVDGCERLLAACGRDGFGLAWTAYVLATAYWETAHRMQPVIEGFFLGDKAGAKHRAGLRYSPWYGRGDVQLTWEANYRRADKELGLGGALVLEPDLALRPDISALIAVTGMRCGWFTTKRLGDYLPEDGFAGVAAFKQARRIINGTDKAGEIAVVAIRFQDALQMGDWR